MGKSRSGSSTLMPREIATAGVANLKTQLSEGISEECNNFS